MKKMYSKNQIENIVNDGIEAGTIEVDALPEIESGDAGKVLTVNEGETGAVWAEATGGELYEHNLYVRGTTDTKKWFIFCKIVNKDSTTLKTSNYSTLLSNWVPNGGPSQAIMVSGYYFLSDDTSTIVPIIGLCRAGSPILPYLLTIDVTSSTGVTYLSLGTVGYAYDLKVSL